MPKSIQKRKKDDRLKFVAPAIVVIVSALNLFVTNTLGIKADKETAIAQQEAKNTEQDKNKAQLKETTAKVQLLLPLESVNNLVQTIDATTKS